MSAMPAISLPKPRLRGVLHAYAAPVAAFIGLLFIVYAEGARARTGTIVWAVALTGLFTVSAIYHRGTWRPAVKAWWQRVDHSMIFVLIAGSYTPICLMVLEGAKSAVLLAIVWGGALAGVATRLLWHTAPRWLFVPMYIALGWVAVAVMPDLAMGAPWVANALLVTGGVLYTLGALVFATKWPNPWPSVFGFHEIFHALTIAAALCHTVAIALLVL
jgi:hemolysin III